MTKRFFISYSLITLFLLDSVVLFAQCENAFAQQWKIEDASHALQVIERTDTLELIVPDGLTMWYQQRLAGVSVPLNTVGQIFKIQNFNDNGG